MKSNPTAHDVARLAKVSQSAVSRAFTSGASIAVETRERILAAANELGYRPNAIARTLITRRSRMIGLVMSYLENQFYPLVIERLSQALQRDGYHILLFITETADADGVLNEILQYQVDGIVMASTTLSSGLAQACAAAGIPVVLFNRVSQPSKTGGFSSSSVTSENRVGGQMVGKLLIKTGHSKIAYLAGLKDSSTSRQREAGLNEALNAAGLTVFSREEGNYDFFQAQCATRKLLASKKGRPDALFAANDHMAIAAIETIRSEFGLRVPEDISVVGFDNVPQASWPSFRLTTVQQNIDEMISATKALLYEQMQGEVRPHQVHVACALILRDSVKGGSNVAKVTR